MVYIIFGLANNRELYAANAKVGATEKALHRAFRVFDKDGGGTIDTQEFFLVCGDQLPTFVVLLRWL
eukprot:COSAG01_NODE_3646_length_5830_cov_7.276217_7_plen_67_part_00